MLALVIGIVKLAHDLSDFRRNNEIDWDVVRSKLRLVFKGLLFLVVAFLFFLSNFDAARTLCYQILPQNWIEPIRALMQLTMGTRSVMLAAQTLSTYVMMAFSSVAVISLFFSIYWNYIFIRQYGDRIPGRLLSTPHALPGSEAEHSALFLQLSRLRI